MHMKRHRYIFLALILPALVFPVAIVPLIAQEVDHIYLKSGSVIRGNIIEIDPSDHVKIADLCGNIWYYQIGDVEKVTSEPFRSDRKIPGSLSGFHSGFVNMTSVGFLAGASSNLQVAPFSILMVNGWRNALGVFAGAGLGIEFLSTSYMPMFIDFRYDLYGKDVVPYIMGKGGYTVPLSSGYTEYDTDYTYAGGPLFGAGVGLKIRSRSHFAWDIELLYRYMETSYKEIYHWNDQEYNFKDIYKRLEVRLGFYID